jgi:hypothetical protein
MNRKEASRKAHNAIVRRAKLKSDYLVSDHGSIMLVEPQTEAARKHLKDSTDGTWFSGALAVEPRYVESLVHGLESDGYTVGVSA